MAKAAMLLLPLLLLGVGCNTTTATNVTTTGSNLNTLTPSSNDMDANTETQADDDSEAESDAEAAAEAGNEDDEAAVIVTISAAGFSPASLAIKAGTTVTFLNNDTVPHWPASNPHPTHTGLVGFDSKAGVAPGASYSYTFEAAGSFGFHDHLNPGMTGTVVVEE